LVAPPRRGHLLISPFYPNPGPVSLFEEISVPFANPPIDPLGYDAVEGKLTCGHDRIDLHFKQRDRAFRKNPNLVASFDYGEVEKIELVSRWFRPKTLVVQVRAPEKLSDFPGAGVGRVDLRLLPGAQAEALKAIHLVEFRRTEAALDSSERRRERPDLEAR